MQLYLENIAFKVLCNYSSSDQFFFFSVPHLAKNQLGWIRDVGELSGSVADCVSVLNDI